MKYYILKILDSKDNLVFKSFANKKDAKFYIKMSIKRVSFCLKHRFNNDDYECKCKRITLHEVNEKLIEEGRI